MQFQIYFDTNVFFLNKTFAFLTISFNEEELYTTTTYLFLGWNEPQAELGQSKRVFHKWDKIIYIHILFLKIVLTYCKRKLF